MTKLTDLVSGVDTSTPVTSPEFCIEYLKETQSPGILKWFILVDGVKFEEFDNKSDVENRFSDLQHVHAPRNWYTISGTPEEVSHWEEDLLSLEHQRVVKGFDKSWFYLDREDKIIFCRKIEDDNEVFYVPTISSNVPCTPVPKTTHNRAWGATARLILSSIMIPHRDIMRRLDSRMVKTADAILNDQLDDHQLTLSIEMHKPSIEHLREVVRLGDMLDSSDPSDIVTAAGDSFFMANYFTETAPILLHSLQRAQTILQTCKEEDFAHLDLVIVQGVLNSTYNMINDRLREEVLKQRQFVKNTLNNDKPENQHD